MLIHAEKFGKYNSFAAIDSRNAAAWVSSSGAGITSVTATGRFGANCISMFGSDTAMHVEMPFTSTQLFFQGAVYVVNSEGSIGAARTYTLVRVTNTAGTQHFRVGMTTGGAIFIEDSAGVILQTTEYVFKNARWHYLEIDIEVQNGGDASVKVDGVEVLSATAQDFLNGASAINVVRFTNVNGTTRWDDVVVMDAAGSELNALQGDMRLVMDLPDADGAVTDWTSGNGGAHYTNIDEALGTTPDDTDSANDYIDETTTNEASLASHAALSASGATDILFAGLTVLAREVTTSTDQVALRVVSDGNTEDSAGLDLGSTYIFRSHYFPLDPDGSVPWTAAQIDAAEWGVVKAA